MTMFSNPTTALAADTWRSRVALSRKSLTWMLFSVSVGLSALGMVNEARQEWVFDFAAPVAGSGPSNLETFFNFTPASGITHAPSIALGADRMRILWFEGSAEAMPDVTIAYRDFALGTLDEIDSGTLLSPGGTTQAMTPGQPVVILGNTIAGRTGDLSDYYATIVSAGGWAAASVGHVRTLPQDGVLQARKLPLSPLLNRSNLVRSSGFAYADGDIGLPVYHELLGAFGEILRIGPEGRIKSSARIGQGKIAIQPEIVVTGPESAVAFLRPWDGSGRVLRSFTSDGGRHWTPPVRLDVENPNSPVSVLRLSDGRFLMAANADATNDARIELMISGDEGLTWSRLHILEDGKGPRQAARYPDMMRLPDGRIVLVYSVSGKKGIKAHVFSEGWVNSLG